MSELNTTKPCFIVYMTNNTYRTMRVSRNLPPSEVDRMLQGQGNWYGTEYATTEEQAIREAIRGGYNKAAQGQI